jgi:hypothetical protein
MTAWAGHFAHREKEFGPHAFCAHSGPLEAVPNAGTTRRSPHWGRPERPSSVAGQWLGVLVAVSPDGSAQK